MRFTEIAASDFDLSKTLSSGQVFHWEKHRDGFVGTIGHVSLFVQQCGPFLKAISPELDGLNPSSSKISADAKGFCASSDTSGPAPSSGRSLNAVARMVSHYFALDHSLRTICRSFPDDPVMNAARDFCRGLRIIRQPKWECLATFICSSMKQVAHIRQISQALRERFGAKAAIYGTHVYHFPSAERLAQSNEKELRECALGYRAKNLLATAQRVAAGEVDLEAWSALPEKELREQLGDLPGVGPKVANCVMLFAYERVAAFPIDVWIGRVLRENYFRRKGKVTPRILAKFAADHFGPHGGYAQQYLFHHARSLKGR